MRNQITIQEANIPIVEYLGNRVVTFAMIDTVHKRPTGTAKRNFKENRHRFIDNEDYYLVDFTKKDEFLSFGVNVPPRGLLVFTETGYMMLVKSLTDDLAWNVQRELVNHYFRTQPQYGLKSLPTTQSPRAKTYVKGGLELWMQDDINDLIKERLANVEQERKAGMSIKVYSAINTKFGTKGMLHGYKNIAPEHFDNIVQFVSRLPLDETQLLTFTEESFEAEIGKRIQALPRPAAMEGDHLPKADANNVLQLTINANTAPQYIGIKFIGDETTQEQFHVKQEGGYFTIAKLPENVMCFTFEKWLRYATEERGLVVGRKL